jgi:ribosome-associated translation inhibitor RaiA
MYVQVNTSNGIQKTEALERWAADYLNEHLHRFNQDVTAIEVQLSDENQAAKGGISDKRCMMEARVTGHAPVAVKNFAPDQDLAFRGAAEKLSHALDRTLGKLDRHDHRARHTIRRDVDAVSEVPPETDVPLPESIGRD